MDMRVSPAAGSRIFAANFLLCLPALCLPALTASAQTYATVSSFSTSPTQSGNNQYSSTITTTVNQTITLNMTFTGSLGTPTGGVSFDQETPPVNSSNPPCPYAPLNNGHATCSFNMLPVGSYFGQTFYGGDSNYGESFYTDLYINVSKGSPALCIDVPAQQLCDTSHSGYLGTSTSGSSFSVTASFSGNISPNAPTGTVAFQSNGQAISGCTAVSISNGSATCTTTSLATGGDFITASYNGDSNFNSASTPQFAFVEIGITPTITFSVPTHHTVDQPFNVSASSNSSGTIYYSVNSGPASINGNTVTLNGTPGNVQLFASQVANGSYVDGSQTANFNVVAGSVWLGANQASEVAVYGSDGAGLFIPTGAGIAAHTVFNGPQAAAFDSSGNYWVASNAGVSSFNWQGTPLVSSAIVGGGIANPVSLAIDGSGYVWIANTNGTISVLNNSGTAITPASGYPAAVTGTPGALAIDLSGNVWVTTPGAGKVTEILGAATPAAPPSTALVNGTTGAQP